ncbi:hypothetical protein F5Y10DRAFT_243704 [Nemania abortiva]|nr:hypothetical protein F5Y10DRAFT_243704 [Nemania abortiva]
MGHVHSIQQDGTMAPLSGPPSGAVPRPPLAPCLSAKERKKQKKRERNKKRRDAKRASRTAAAAAEAAKATTEPTENEDDDEDMLSAPSPDPTSPGPASSPSFVPSPSPSPLNSDPDSPASPGSFNLEEEAAAADASAAVAIGSTNGHRARPEAGARRAVPCDACLRSAVSGKSRGVACYDSATSSRCQRCINGHACHDLKPHLVPVAVRLVDGLEANSLTKRQITMLRGAARALQNIS